jgi:hypothetical protein
MACAIFIFACVHMAHAYDEVDSGEYGMQSFRFIRCHFVVDFI